MNFEKENFPKHIAIIMDGNRRWAKQRDLPAKLGHKEGAKTLEKIVRYANKIGLGYITVYAFSTENWKRAEEEVKTLMSLFQSYLDDYSKRADSENIKVKIQQQLYKYYDNDKINISYNNTIKVMINKKINTNTYEEKTTTERWKDFIKQNNINTDLVVINVEYRDLNTNSSRYYNVNRNKWSGSYNEAS